MTEKSPTFNHSTFINYKWLIYYLLNRDDLMVQHILSGYYIDDPVHNFLKANIAKNEQGELAPSEMDPDDIIELLSSFFDADIWDTYCTHAESNIDCWHKVLKTQELGLEDILIANVIPFETKLAPVFPLKSKMLPGAIRGYVSQQAKAMDESPPDFTATALFVALAALLGNSINIQPKVHVPEWRFPPVMWVANIGLPSTKKTPSINAGIRPLKHAVKTVLEPRNKEALRQYKIEMKVFEAKQKALRRELDDAAKEHDESLANEKATELASLEKPVLKNRDFITNDATQEAIVLKMSQNDNGLLYIRDELVGWILSMEKQNQSHARSYYLESYNGTDPYLFDRKTSDPIEVERNMLHVVGGIQPSKLAPLLKSRQSGTSDDGLLERILKFSVYPDHDGNVYVDESFDFEPTERVNRLFLNAAQIERPNDPLVLKFSTEAQALWDIWAAKHVQKVNEATESNQAIYGKQAQHCAKLALLIHMMLELDKDDFREEDIESKIQPDALKLAFEWVTYLDSHIERIINFAEEDNEFYLARELLNRLKRLDLEDGFDAKFISDKGWAMFKKKEAREEALEKLVEHNYLLAFDEGTGTRPRLVYYLHPSLI